MKSLFGNFMGMIDNLVDSLIVRFTAKMSREAQTAIEESVAANRARLRMFLSVETIKSLLFGFLALVFAWGITWFRGGEPLIALSEDWSTSNYVLLMGLTLVFTFFMATFLQRDDNYGNLSFNNGSSQGISAHGNKSVGMYLFTYFVLALLLIFQIFFLGHKLNIVNFASFLLPLAPLFMGDTLSSNARYEGTAMTNILLWLVACAYLLVR